MNKEATDLLYTLASVVMLKQAQELKTPGLPYRTMERVRSMRISRGQAPQQFYGSPESRFRSFPGEKSPAYAKRMTRSGNTGPKTPPKPSTFKTLKTLAD